MERLDLFASMRHYAEHAAAVWLALEPQERGTVYLMGTAAEARYRLGFPEATVGPPPRGGRPCLVASWMDGHTAGSRGRPLVLTEHGAGQTYVGAGAGNPSYSGGEGWERAVLFLGPSETVAQRWRRRYPETPAVAIGCPRLDGWHRRPRPPSPRPTVAISFHHDARLVPETTTAWRVYDPALGAAVAELERAGVHVLGHSHPRLSGALGRRWEQLGVEVVPEFTDVLDRAWVYAVDNSSTGFEFMSLGRPGVWLDAPWYRRDVEHGMRFWSLSDGAVHVTDPHGLAGALLVALEDTDGLAARRAEVTRAVYMATDGYAAARGVGAIREILQRRC